MKRILSLSSVFAVVLAFSLTGCDSGGNMGEGVPKEEVGKKFEGLTGPGGSKPLSTDMSEHGLRPPPKGDTKGTNPVAPK